MRSTSPLFQPASRLSFSITHVLLLFVIGLLVVDSAHAQCTTSWTNAGGGLWSDAGNWDDGVPDAADDACLTLDATYTVDLDVDATVNSLTLGAMSGANTQALAIGPFDDLTVLMPSTITADGEIVWSGGSLNGPGAGVFNNAGLITLTGASVKTLAGDNGGAVDPVLRNTGTVSHEEGQLNVNLSAGVENAGLYDLQADVDLDYASGNLPAFTNEAAGTLRKSTGGAQSFFDVPFTNSGGTVEANAGELRFTRSGTLGGGSYDADAGAVLLFDGGTFTASGTLSGAPDGFVGHDAGATLTTAGAATLDFGGTGYQWTGGDVSAPGAGLFTNAGLFRLTGTATKTLVGDNGLAVDPVLRNTGTVSHEEGQLNANLSAGVENAGLYDLQADVDLDYATGNAPGFTNEAAGTLRKSTGVGESTFDVPITNSGGLVEVVSGELHLTRSGTLDGGSYAAALGTILLFDGGTFTASGTLSGAPDGFVGHDAGATLTTAGAATLAFTGAGYQWTGGTVSAPGAGLFTNAGLFRLTGAGTKSLNGDNGLAVDPVLRNTGTVSHEEGQLNVNLSAGVENAGLYDLQADVDLDYATGNAPGFTNEAAGTLRKSTGAGESTFDVLITNAGGTVEVVSGELHLTRSGTLGGGSYDADAGAVLLFDGGTFTASGTLSGAPDGFVGHDVTLTVADGTAATLDFGGTGYQWTGGVVSAPGTGLLTNAGLFRLTGAGTKSLNGDNTGSDPVFRNTGTVSHEEGQLNMNLSAGIENAGLYDLQADVDLDYATGSAPAFTNEAGGTIEKSTGTGTSIVDVATTNEAGGVIQGNAGTLAFTRSLDNRPDGVIEGAATVAPPTSASNITLNGDVAPGNSVDILNWSGTYAPRVGGRLVTELGGLTPGTEHDQLVVSGTATLGGILKIQFDGSYTPTVGDSYTILTAGSVVDAFDSVEEPAGWSFDIIYGATQVVITAQPVEDVTATLTPQTGPADGPVIVPASGGPVQYRARLENTTAEPQTVDIWIDGLTPNGSVYQGAPLVGPVTRTLNAGQVLGPVSLSQPVTASIAAGVYALRIRVGTYPDTVIDEDAFVVVKEEAAERVAGDAPLADRSASPREASSAWVVYEVTDGAPVLAAATMTEAEAAALEAAMRGAADEAAAHETEATRQATGAASEAAAGESLPAAYALHASAPNPFSDRATLRYDLPEAAHVRIAVYDVLGREVARLVDAEREAGRHRATLDGRDLAAGLYVVRLTVGGQAFAQRVTLAR